MSGRRYLKPNWMQRNVGNRIAPLFQPKMIAKLTVPGRRTGRLFTVPVAMLDHGGERYLLAYRGESDWARNLRAAGSGRLRLRGKDEDITVVEVPADERGELFDAYRERFAKMPTVGGVLDAMPDPADHPTFRIVS